MKVVVGGAEQYLSLWPVHRNKIDGLFFALYPQHAELHSYETDVKDIKNGEGRVPDHCFRLYNLNNEAMKKAIEDLHSKCSPDGKFLTNDIPWSLVENCSMQEGHSCISIVHKILTHDGGLADKITDTSCGYGEIFLKNPESYYEYIQKVAQRDNIKYSNGHNRDQLDEKRIEKSVRNLKDYKSISRDQVNENRQLLGITSTINYRGLKLHDNTTTKVEPPKEDASNIMERLTP